MTRKKQKLFYIFLFILSMKCSFSQKDNYSYSVVTDSVKKLFAEAQYSQAEKYLEDVLGHSVNSSDRFIEGISLKFLGNLFSPQYFNIPAKSDSYYERAFNLIDSLIINCKAASKPVSKEYQIEAANILNNRALLNESENDFDTAIKLLNKVIEIDKAINTTQVQALTKMNLGRAIRNKGLYAENQIEAKKFFIKSVQVFEESIKLNPDPDCYLNISRSYQLLNNHDSAVATCILAGTIYFKTGKKLSYAMSLLNLGLLYKYHAEVRYTQGEKNLIETVATEFRTAKDSLLKGLEILELSRGKINSDMLRSTFFEDKIFYYEQLIDILLILGENEKAFSFVESVKARSFLDLLEGKELGKKDSYSPEVGRIIKKLKILSEQIRELADQPDSASSLSVYVKLRDKLETELQQLAPEYSGLKTAKTIDPALLRGNLDAKTGILEFFTGKTINIAFLVTNKGILVRRMNTESFSLIDSVNAINESFADFTLEKEKFYKILQGKNKKKKVEKAEFDKQWNLQITSDKFQYQLLTLYGFLIGREFTPKLKELETLIIVPHGVLHHFPFTALISSPLNLDLRTGQHIVRPKYFFEEKKIVMAPSASLFALFKGKKKLDSEGALVIGDPDYPTEEWVKLQYAAKEAEKVIEYFDKNTSLLLKNKDADEATIKKIIGKYCYIHLATHGLFKSSALESRIILAASPNEDGYLTVAEIFNLELNSELVVLSACQSGMMGGYVRNRLSGGDDLVGLTRAFLYAGTRSIIATLWSVDDLATGSFMQTFYDSFISQKKSKLEALNFARLKIVDDNQNPEFRHPFYWAPFFITGSY